MIRIPSTTMEHVATIIKTLLHPNVGFAIVAFDNRQKEIKSFHYIGSENRMVSIDAMKRCVDSLETANKINEHVKQQSHD